MNYTEKFAEWRLVRHRIKRCSTNVFARKNDVKSVADGDRRCIALELYYASLISIDPGVQIDAT